MRLPTRREGTAHSGFTLVEVMSAVGVLALVMMTSITTMQRALSNFDTAQNIAIANSILQAEMEKERLFTWTKVNDSSYRPAINADLLSNPKVASRFTLSRTVATASGRTDKMVQVTLTVCWRTFDGRTLTRNATGNFTNSGLNDLFIAQF